MEEGKFLTVWDARLIWALGALVQWEGGWAPKQKSEGLSSFPELPALSMTSKLSLLYLGIYYT